MSAAAPARFTFDLDLGRRQEKARSVSESAVETMLADARTAAYAEGFSAGEQSVASRTAQQLSQAAAALGDHVAAMAAQMDDARRQNLGEAVGLATAIARKLAGALLSRQPVEEIEALVVDCMASLEGVPHLVIRCRDELAEAVRATAQSRMQTSGFTGRLVVIGDPDLGLTDCRIEWADGGVVRNVSELSAQIDERIAAFLLARGIATPDDLVTEPAQETQA